MTDTTTVDRGDDFTPTADDPKDLKLNLEKAELDEHISKPKESEGASERRSEPVASPADGSTPVRSADEGDGTSAVEGKQDDPEHDKDKERSKVIPRERFDKAQEKARAREEALQAKIQDLEKQTTATKMSADVAALRGAIEDLQDKYEDAVLDGKKGEAKAIRQELARLQDVMIEVKTNVSSEAAKRETIQELKYDAALAKAESDHPELNPDSDQYDPALTDEVGVLLESFVLRGFTRDAALNKAVRYVVGVPAKKDPDNVDAKKVAQEREQMSRKRSADAMAKQPASMTKAGIDSDKAGNKDGKDIDIMRISQERFAKIDEETLARLRGDSL